MTHGDLLQEAMQRLETAKILISDAQVAIEAVLNASGGCQHDNEESQTLISGMGGQPARFWCKDCDQEWVRAEELEA